MPGLPSEGASAMVAVVVVGAGKAMKRAMPKRFEWKIKARRWWG